jgi:hypothetical protein
MYSLFITLLVISNVVSASMTSTKTDKALSLKIIKKPQYPILMASNNNDMKKDHRHSGRVTMQNKYHPTGILSLQQKEQEITNKDSYKSRFLQRGHFLSSPNDNDHHDRNSIKYSNTTPDPSFSTMIIDVSDCNTYVRKKIKN